MSDPSHILWFDLETTGLDVKKDYIVEVGCFLSNLALQPIPDTEIQALVSDYRQLAVRKIHEDEYVTNMHTESGLLEDLYKRKGLKLREIEDEILIMLDELAIGKVILGGSGVATYDLPLVKMHMPRLAERLMYYTMDIGVIRRYIQLILSRPDMTPTSENIKHRALIDAKDAHLQAHSYRYLFNLPRYRNL